jgi:hypothetical protein
MNLAAIPVANELFAQWRKARGERLDPAMRPFSRRWEDLLEDAELLSAIDRSDAERDARILESNGWLELKSVRYRPQQIERIVIPLAQEARWREAFGFTPPNAEEARLIQQFDWASQLAFVRDIRLNISFSELRSLNDFLLRGAGIDVPIKERSLEIFGDEKRLDLLAGSSLFREGRLTLAQLRCFTVIEPIGWQRGPTSDGPMIVLENAATWDSYRRWNEKNQHFSAVLYGQGNCFAERTPFLKEIFRELGGERPSFYFGDLDAAGLRIPLRASRIAQKAGLPPIHPHLPSYRTLLRSGKRISKANEDDLAQRADFDWLGELADEGWNLLGPTRRLAQEHIGAEMLNSAGFK